MFRFSSAVQCLLVSALVLGTGGICAKPRDVQAGPAVRANLPDTVRRVERETGGEVLRAEPMQRDGREVYRLKVLTADGRVRVVQDDPNAPRPRDRSFGSKQKQSSRDSDGEQPQF